MMLSRAPISIGGACFCLEHVCVDSATQDQLDELRDAIEAAKKVRAATTRRQQALEEQAARLGLDAPPHITTELVDLGLKIKAKSDEIRELERSAARLELAPKSALEFSYGSTLPQLAPAVVDTRLQVMERQLERVLDALVQLGDEQDATRAESREWRQHERTERQEGQSRRLALALGTGFVLLMIVFAVIAIAIKVWS
jgi:septal ring factor EnvC (AmiA/AmiB activator)